jgi:hypothetical protein
MTAYGGRFRSKPLAGKTVNVKWYLKQESVLDMTNSHDLQYYLVTAASAKEKTRPWLIEFVYLFDARRLLDELRLSKAKIGPPRACERNSGVQRRSIPTRRPQPL